MKYESYYLLSDWHLVCDIQSPTGAHLILFDITRVCVNSVMIESGTLDFCAVLDSDYKSPLLCYIL